MKVQYLLVDVETKKAIPVGKEFELVDFLKPVFDGGAMSWPEAFLICGDPLSDPPTGILDGSQLIKETP